MDKGVICLDCSPSSYLATSGFAVKVSLAIVECYDTNSLYSSYCSQGLRIGDLSPFSNRSRIESKISILAVPDWPPIGWCLRGSRANDIWRAKPRYSNVFFFFCPFLGVHSDPHWRGIIVPMVFQCMGHFPFTHRWIDFGNRFLKPEILL